MNKRSCGGCTACCKTHVIMDLNKKSGVWCDHCRIGNGCAIYSIRPLECRGYQCLWLSGLGADGDRPDVTQVVLEHQDSRTFGMTLCMFEVEDGALDSQYFYDMTKEAVLSGKSVLQVGAVKQPVLYLAKGKRPNKAFAIMEQSRRKMKMVTFDRSMWR